MQALSQQTVQLIQATMPILETRGVEITRHFYARVFNLYPSLKTIFNLDHQNSGQQPMALALSIYRFAQYATDLSQLDAMFDRIAHKHASVGIAPEHYPIVGENLLASLSEVLGEVASPEILNAWGEAYGLYADIMIQREKTLYQQALDNGAWLGFRELEVFRKEAESEQICSFYLRDPKGHDLPPYKAGQYISVAVQVPSLGHQQLRQYSLSDASNSQYWRISVKRENDPQLIGVSRHLHQNLQVGDRLAVTAPFGEFYLEGAPQHPIALVSGGVGLTPMLSMLNTVVEQGGQQDIYFVHGTQNSHSQAQKTHIQTLGQQYAQLHNHVFYSDPLAQDQLGTDYQHLGNLDLAVLQNQFPANTHYYLCGPSALILNARRTLKTWNVPDEQVHFEHFGSHTDIPSSITA